MTYKNKRGREDFPRVENNRIGIYSFFSCSGFLDLGFELANGNPYEVRMANEIDEHFRKCYRYARAHLNRPINLSDDFIFPNSISDFVKWGGRPKRGCEEIYHRFSQLLEVERQNGRVFGFIGGPPCPDFSVAGKNAGKNGDVGPLSSKYVRLICQERPHFFVFENVKGLLSSGKHFTYFKSLCVKLSEQYYFSYRLVNALWYGVPQYRERLIIVGIRRDLVENYSNRKMGEDLHWEDFQWTKRLVIDARNQWPTSQPFNPDPNVTRPIDRRGVKDLSIKEWWEKNDVVNHPNQVNQTKPSLKTIARIATIREGNTVGKSYHRLHRWKYAFTACYGHNEVPLHPWENRRISVAEALATQSLPRDFSFPVDMGISALFKAVGNGVPFLMSQRIAEMVHAFLVNRGIFGGGK